MDQKPKPKPDDEEQSKRFIDTARKMDADQDSQDFTMAIETIIPSKKVEKTPRGK